MLNRRPPSRRTGFMMTTWRAEFHLRLEDGL
jgi:hypothetical protein